jgi:hypothetical protein
VTYLLGDWESHSVVQLTELKDFIVGSWFLGFELIVSDGMRAVASM